MTYTFTGQQIAGLKIILGNMGFAYQRRWFIDQRPTRHITKTRQCGADWYFSLEALIDAAETGRNQNFLSPDICMTLLHSRAQIVHFAAQVGVTIEPGDYPIILSNGAELRFFDERSHFAGFYGNTYVSEYAWADSPARLCVPGRALAAHSKYRFTAYTSPSASHEAYLLWASEKEQNKQRLSAEDALRQGSSLLDLPALKSALPAQEFELSFSAVWPQEKTEGAA